MIDLICKPFEFEEARVQKSYDSLQQTIRARTQLDLEFLERFIHFSSECVCSTQFLCAKTANVTNKDNMRISYLTFCAEYLGLSESTVKKLYLTYERFIIQTDVGLNGKKTFSWLVSDFSEMSLSKIFELLPISIEQLNRDFGNGTLSPYMTVKQLREYVHTFSAHSKETLKVLETARQETEQLEKENLRTYYVISNYITYFKEVGVRVAKEFRTQVIDSLQDIQRILCDEFKLKTPENGATLDNTSK